MKASQPERKAIQITKVVNNYKPVSDHRHNVSIKHFKASHNILRQFFSLKVIFYVKIINIFNDSSSLTRPDKGCWCVVVVIQWAVYNLKSIF